MKKTIATSMILLALIGCKKEDAATTQAEKTMSGFYLNNLTSSEKDTTLLGISFDENVLIDVNHFAVETAGMIAKSTPFTLRYSPEFDDGVIVPKGHSSVDSIRFFRDANLNQVVGLVYYGGSKTDSLQVFDKDDKFAEFIREQKLHEEAFPPRPQFCDGPAGESELDTTSNIGLDLEFITGEKTKLITATAAATWLGTTVLATTVSYGVTNLYNCIFKDDSAAVANEKKLTEILEQTKQINDKLNSIQATLKQLDAKFDRTKAEEKISSRNAMYTAIHEVNYRYYNKLKALRNDPALVADTSKMKAAIVPIIQEWGETTVDGSPASTSMKRVINMILENVSGRNLFQVYDLYVFNTHNFENEGYADRDAFRASDFGMVTESAFLSKMFYIVNGEDTMVKQTDEDLTRFIKFYDNNQVKRNDDKCICQIFGAHLVLEKKPRRITYENPSWISGVIATGYREDKMNVNTSRIIHADQPAKFITSAEASAILKAYGGKEPLESIFYKYGNCELLLATPTYIPLSDNHSFGWPKVKYSFDMQNRPKWVDIKIRTADGSHPDGYNQLLGRMSLSGEVQWRKQRVLFIKKTVFDTWALSYKGWESQSTNKNWWNFDVITRY